MLSLFENLVLYLKGWDPCQFEDLLLSLTSFVTEIVVSFIWNSIANT